LASEELQQLAVARNAEGRGKEGGRSNHHSTGVPEQPGAYHRTDRVLGGGDLLTNRTNRNPGRPREPEDPR